MSIKTVIENLFCKKQSEEPQRIVTLNFGEIGKIAQEISKLNHVKAYSADIGNEMPVIVVEVRDEPFDINKAELPEDYRFDGEFLTNKGNVMIGFTSNYKIFYHTKDDELVRIMEKK